MGEKQKKLILKLFGFILIICSITLSFQTEVLAKSGSDQSILTKKISRSYTKKFCNAIGFGLSKESAMKFSIEENRQVFKNKNNINTIDKELLAEEIATTVVERCGYPINLSGEKGIMEFKKYYLSQDK